MSLNRAFWIVIIAFLLLVGSIIGPIFYRAIAMRGICKEQADVYNKYKSKSYVSQRLDEELSRIGIPASQREHSIKVLDDGVYVQIYYEDTANFFDYYKKDFEFEYECKGVLRSLLTP